jgi:putative FmdB family regulatory protein
MLRLFDFRCTKCGNEFEKLVDSDKLSAICPICEGHADKQVSTPSIKVTGLGTCDSKMRV